MKWYSTQKLVIFRSSLSRDIGPKRQIVTEMPSKSYHVQVHVLLRSRFVQ